MKINEIIRERRLAKKLTQEQVAAYLGVTAPAVNKWEKASTYPDITILPALARLLDTDLNTLLSFKEDLTQKEVILFINTLPETAEKEGFVKTYDIAMEKIKEYPTCDLLILNIALTLEGILIMDKAEEYEHYQALFETLYQRVLNSSDESVRNQAQSILISKYMSSKEFEKAEEMLELLPDKNQVDKKQLQAKLSMAYGKLDEAAKLEEEKLLSAVNEVQSILLMLMEIALKDGRIQDAEYIADISKKSAELFDMWEYQSYVAHFQLYVTCKNKLKSLKILFPMLKSVGKQWDINSSQLYRHIEAKQVDVNFGKKMKKTIIQSIQEDEQTAFLKNSKEFEEIADEIHQD